MPGIRVGQVTDEHALTGCTVILCEQGAIGGVDIRGGATGTRDLGPLDPSHIAPVHTMVDGDLMFALSLGSQAADLHRVGFAATDALAQAVVRAVTRAQSREGIPCYAEITGLAPE